jgi:hypothetical protein
VYLPLLPTIKHQLFETGVANAAVGNAANQYKIGRYVDLTNTGGQGIYGAPNTLNSIIYSQV